MSVGYHKEYYGIDQCTSEELQEENLMHCLLYSVNKEWSFITIMVHNVLLNSFSKKM